MGTVSNTLMMKTGNPQAMWEQMPAEGKEAYAAFITYRDLGIERSVVQAYRVAKDKPDAMQANGTWNEWASRFQWKKRAESWDQHVRSVLDQAELDEVTKMKRRHTRISMGFQDKVVRFLQDMDPSELSPKQAAAWFDIAVKIERLSRDVATSTTRTVQEVSGPGGGPIDIRVTQEDPSLESDAIIAAEQAYYERLYGEESPVMGGEERDSDHSLGESTVPALQVPGETLDGQIE